MELLLSGIEASTPMIEAATALMSARQSMGGASAVEPVKKTNKRPRKPAGTVGQTKEKTTKKQNQVAILPAVPVDGGAVSGVNDGWHVPVAAPVAAQHRQQYQQQHYRQHQQAFQPNTPVTYQHNQHQHQPQQQQLQQQQLQQQQQQLQEQQQQLQRVASPLAPVSSVQSFQAGPLQHQLLRPLQQQQLQQHNEQRQLQQHQQQQHARQQYAQHLQQQRQRQQIFQMQQELKQTQQQELHQQQQQQEFQQQRRQQVLHQQQQELQQQQQQQQQLHQQQRQEELQQQRRQQELQQQQQLEFQQQLQQHLQGQQQQELRQQQQRELRQQQEQELRQRQQHELQQQQQQRELLRQQQLQLQKQQQQQRDQQRQIQQQQQRDRNRHQHARRMQQELKQQQMLKMQEEFRQQEQRSAVIRPGSSIVPPPYQRQPHLLEIDPRLRSIPGVPVLMHGDILRPVPPLRRKQPVKSNESQSKFQHGQSQGPGFQMQQRQRPPVISQLNHQRPQLSNEGRFQHALWPNEHHRSPAASAVGSSFTGIPRQPSPFGETASTGIQPSVLPSLRFRTEGETFELTSLIRTQSDAQGPTQLRNPTDGVGINRQTQPVMEKVSQTGSKDAVVGEIMQSSAAAGGNPRSKHLSNNRLRKMNKQTERKEKRSQKELQKIKAMLQPPSPQHDVSISETILTPQQRGHQDPARLKALAKKIDRGTSVSKSLEHAIHSQVHAREQDQLLRQAQLAMLANQQLQNRNPFEFPSARPLPTTVPRNGASSTSESGAANRKRPRECDEQAKVHTVAVPGAALVWKGVERELQRAPPMHPTSQSSSSVTDTARGHEVSPRELVSGPSMAQAHRELRMVPEAAFNTECGGVTSSIAKPTVSKPRRRKPAVPAFISPVQSILPKNPADTQTALPPTSVSAPSGSSVDRVQGQVAGGAHAASLSAANQEVRESIVAEKPVARPESDTVMVFCKRDFMRFQAGLLWRKYQEIKRKRDQTLATVTGRRARYLSARYQDAGQSGATTATGKRAGKRARNGDEPTRNDSSVVEILDDDDDGNGDAANQPAASDQASTPTSDSLLKPAARNEMLTPTSDLMVLSVATNEPPATTSCSSLETPASDAAMVAMDSSSMKSAASDEAAMTISGLSPPSEATTTTSSSSLQSSRSDEATLTMSTLSLQSSASDGATKTTSSSSPHSAALDDARMKLSSSSLQSVASDEATMVTNTSPLQSEASGETTVTMSSRLLPAAFDEASTSRQAGEHIEPTDSTEIRDITVLANEEEQHLHDEQVTMRSTDNGHDEHSGFCRGEPARASVDEEMPDQDECAASSTDLTNETTAPSEATSSPDDDWFSSVELIEADGTAAIVLQGPVVVSAVSTQVTTHEAPASAAPLLSHAKKDLAPQESEPSGSAINGIREEVVI